MFIGAKDFFIAKSTLDSESWPSSYQKINKLSEGGD
jgi:hypothetical protein